LIDYTATGNAVFGTAPIGYSVWLFVLPFTVAMLMFEEGRKVIVRRYTGAANAAATRHSVAAAATRS
jgi:hypothetical protein